MFVSVTIFVIAFLFGPVFADTTISNIVPSCAQQCLAISLQSSFKSLCSNLTDYRCLCSKDDVDGYSLGELALKCLYTTSSCGAPDLRQGDSIYRICDSLSSAVRPPHGSVIITGGSNTTIVPITTVSPDGATPRNSSSPTMPTIVIVASESNSTNEDSRQQSKGIYVAGIVIGTIALLLSTIALLTCLLCIRRRRKQLGLSGFGQFSTLFDRSKEQFTSWKHGDPEAMTATETQASSVSDSIHKTTSCWPKYKRISPPPNTHIPPTKPALVKVTDSLSDVPLQPAAEPRPQSQLNTEQCALNTTNPVSQHHVQAPGLMITKGKGRLMESRPVTPTKSPLRSTRRGYPIPRMSASNSIPSAGSMRDPSRVRAASNSRDSDPQSSRTSNAPREASHRARTDSTRSKDSLRSQKSHTPHDMRKAQSNESQYSAVSNLSSSRRVQQKTVPAPPLPEVQIKSSRRPKNSLKTSKSVQAKLEQRSNHVRYESGTDIETSDCDTNNESDCNASIHGGNVKNRTIASESTFPIADVRYPKIPRSSNSRTSTSVAIPRSSIQSIHGGPSLQTTDRASSTPITKTRTPSRTNSRSSTRSTTSTRRTAASPKTPKFVSQSHLDSNPIIVSNTPPPSNATASTPSLNPAEFSQHPLLKPKNSWSDSAQPQHHTSHTGRLRIDRKDLPASEIYDFF